MRCQTWRKPPSVTGGDIYSCCSLHFGRWDQCLAAKKKIYKSTRTKVGVGRIQICEAGDQTRCPNWKQRPSLTLLSRGRSQVANPGRWTDTGSPLVNFVPSVYLPSSRWDIPQNTRPGQLSSLIYHHAHSKKCVVLGINPLVHVLSQVRGRPS